jgi:CRISPR-associated protein Csd1
MILHALNELYDRLAKNEAYEVAPPGYSLQKITFKVVLKPDGTLLSIEDARHSDDGRLRPRQVIVPGSTKPSGSGINPCFLWDNSGYMLGFRVDDPKPERTRATFEAFCEKHLEHEELVGAPAYSAVCRFLEGWDPGEAGSFPLLEDAAATGFGVFQIQGKEAFVHEDPAVQAWWKSQLAEGDEGVEGQCLVTGESAPLARIHDKIRGVAGAQGAGGTIVGFNEDAYASYGKSQSYNAPVAEEVAFRYVTALNALLDGPMKEKHRLTLGDTTVAFWTERSTETEDIFAEFTREGSTIVEEGETQDEGRRQRVERFLRALREGREAYADLDDDPEGTPFYLLGLAPNSARISVRLFERGTVADLLDNLRRHHRDIAVTPRPAVGRRKPDPEFPAAWMLLSQTAREAKDIPPILASPLLKAIVGGARYPDALFAAVIRRVHADRRVDYLRCCILKGYLNRNLNREVSMSLDPDRTDPAYRLGRLFSALEKTQQDALGGKLNKTIRDTFYSSASATPGSVFPRLLRTYQHHLAKLEGGMRVNRERLVQSILEPLASFPPHLPLPEQGLFAIGYYHQMSDFYTKRSNPSDT